MSDHAVNLRLVPGAIAKLAAAELSNPYLHASSKYRGWILMSSNFKAEG